MNRIREIRKEKGMSVKELAAKVNVSMMTMYRYESGKRVLNVGVAYRIAVALDVGLNELYKQPA